jgi:2-hydroxymuconate-semialdehyde hydrolase
LSAVASSTISHGSACFLAFDIDAAKYAAEMNPTGWHQSSRQLQVDGLRTHVVDCDETPACNGRPALLLHGFICSSWTWRHAIAPLAKDRRVVAPCLKGFGWTERPSGGYGLTHLAEFVLHIMDATNIERAHLVGNSLGGAISLWLARHHPDRVASLVLLNAAASQWRIPSILFKTQKPLLSPLYRLIFRRFVVQRALRTFAYRQLTLDRAFMDAFMAPIQQPGTMRAALAVAHDFQDGMALIERELEAIGQPSLVIHGQQDRLISVKEAHDLTRRLPSSRLVVFKDAGHCPHEEDPLRFQSLTTQFMAMIDRKDDDNLTHC